MCSWPNWGSALRLSPSFLERQAVEQEAAVDDLAVLHCYPLRPRRALDQGGLRVVHEHRGGLVSKRGQQFRALQHLDEWRHEGPVRLSTFNPPGGRVAHDGFRDVL